MQKISILLTIIVIFITNCVFVPEISKTTDKSSKTNDENGNTPNGTIPDETIPSQLELYDLTIQKERIPDFTIAGVEGGIPDSSNWRIIDASTYGASPNDSTDDCDAINAAIDAAANNPEPTIVFLPEGTYELTQPNYIRLRSNVILKGAGPDRTILNSKMGSSSSDGIVIGGSSTNETIAINSGLNRGSNNLSLAGTPSFNAGDFVIVSQNNNDSRIAEEAYHAVGIGQAVKVNSISGNNITIEPPLRVALNSNAEPNVKKVNFIQNAGIENLKIRFADVSPVPTYHGSTIKINYAVNSWVKNIIAENTYHVFIALRYSARISIRSNYFKTMQKTDYTNAYSVDFGALVSDSIAEDNIQDDVWVTAMFSHSCNGNVYAYNYHKNIREDHGIIHHGTFPFENLVEGNEAYRITNDCWWGQQGPRLTFFRNRASEIRTSRNGACEQHGELVADEANFIANTSQYFLSFPWCTYPDGCAAFDDFNTNLWAEMNLYRTSFKGIDTPESTNIFVNNYYGNQAPSSWSNLHLPPSLYLLQKPDFWCQELPWPAIGADIDNYDGSLNLLPAERRDKGLPCTI